ncbi:hypothetical protein EKH55_0077 [Sinorhizobium alkalisoli]|nr:hypothetical protein EKH55_0077 [Sinorhizobium alkalisoli]
MADDAPRLTGIGFCRRRKTPEAPRILRIENIFLAGETD